MKREPDFRREDDPPQVITPRNIALPLWFSWTITTTFIAATVYLMSTLNDIKSKIESVSTDRWKKTHERELMNRLQKANPSLTIPSVDQVAKDLE